MPEVVHTIDSVLAEVLTKRPELKGHAEELKAEIEFMAGMFEMSLDLLAASRAEIRRALKQLEPNVAVIEEAKREFSIWEISPAKVQVYLNLESEEAAYKFMQATLMQEPGSCTWKEAMNIFLMGRLCPKFDVLI